MFQETKSIIVIYYLAGSSIILLLIVAIIVYTFLHQKKVNHFRQKIHDEEIRNQQSVFNALQEGQEKERTRLAEELHDGIAAKLSGLKMNLEYLKTNSHENINLIETIFKGMAETVDEVREISHNLQPYFFNEKDLEQLISTYIDQLNSQNTCKYGFSFNSSHEALAVTIKLHCYRIITELLYNVYKHSKASLASVQVNIEENKVEIVIEDNGVGFYNNETNGIGIMNIRNRIKICKGSLHIDSSEKGTSVIINIPIN